MQPIPTTNQIADILSNGGVTANEKLLGKEVQRLRGVLNNLFSMANPTVKATIRHAMGDAERWP